MKKWTALALVTLLTVCIAIPCFADGPNDGPKAHTQIEADQR